MRINQYELDESKRKGFLNTLPIHQDYITENNVLKPIGDIKEMSFPAGRIDLLNDFLRIDEHNIIHFARKYGLVGYSSYVEPQDRVGGDDISWILNHVKNAKVCIELKKALNDGCKEINIDSKKALNKIKYILNNNISRIRRKISVNSNNIESYFSFETLLDVIYWDLANEIEGGVILKCACEGCNGIFIQTTKGQRYCPRKFDEKESLCAVRDRMRKLRNIKRK